MSDWKNAEQVRAEHIRAMGDQLGELFNVLSNELIALRWLFQELSEFSGGTGERLEVMNRAAPFFFRQVQRSWWDEVLLSVSRLVAPTRSVGNPNLTVRLLPERILDNDLKAHVQALIDVAIARAAFVKPWRDKRIAHRDLDRSLKKAVEPLPAATLADVDRVIVDLAAILNAIQAKYLGSTTFYGKVPITHGLASLLYVVRDGLRREEQRQARLEKGEVREDDWNDHARAL